MRAARNNSDIPFVPVKAAQLDAWGKVVEGDNPFLGIIAMARLCEARLVRPKTLIESYVAHARGPRQAAYTRFVLRHADSTAVAEMSNGFQTIISNAKDFDALRGLTLGLLTADGHRARAVLTRIRLGYADMSALEAIPVADRICEPILESLWLRFRYMDRSEPYFDGLRKLGEETGRPEGQ